MKTTLKRRVFLGVLCSALYLCNLISSHAFSLLGPFTPWMTPDLGYFPNQGDIGGPMALGEEYRWNVPVVTYGFDQSFLDYFGQPGVDAVEQAIQVINDLPPASNIALTNYPLATSRFNYQAQAQTLYDLKTVTLSLLLEQLGLTSPSRYVWTLRHWDAATANYFYQPSKFLDGLWETDLEQAGFIPDYGILRNYDPTILQPTNSINQISYSFYLIAYGPNLSKAITRNFPVDPSSADNGSVADYLFNSSNLSGQFCIGLSQDDVGALLFLLNRTNVHTETLEDSVVAALNSTNTLVRTAPRPGIEKLTFLRHSTNSFGNFAPMTNQFADLYFTNGLLATQMVQRVTAKPDFIFSVKDLGFSIVKDRDGNPFMGFTPIMQRSGTTNWGNNCNLNANPGGAGPGVIHGPIQIIYQDESKYIAAAGGLTNYSCGGALINWGSFSDSDEEIIHTGNQTNITCLTLSTKVISSNGTPTLEWLVLGHQSASYRIESSTNLVDWTVTGSITNTNGIFILHQPLDQPAKYFRTILEE
ncbi:hypothetical protein [Pedosphaera parvula]|uniref:hypothetical protein n=1 Tax=Pedosphaera parvula TaxID=1032527 RepID=UPI001237668B|nr:hypothetical protein [Pedosphaera parvula]